MEFRSDKEAHGFFNFYAYLVGFSIVNTHHYKTTSKKMNGEITSYTYQCYRYGKNEEDGKKKKKTTEQRNTNVINRTDYKCVMVIKEVQNIWKISRLNLEHNHTLSPNREAKFLKSHKNMTVEEKRLIRTLKECNIPTRSMIVILSFLQGGLSALLYNKKDVSNVTTSINSETKNSDMKLMEYLLTKKPKTQDSTTSCC